MGRSIFVDEHVQSSIDDLIVAGKWFTGVIIGQLTHQRDYVVHIASTPDAVEDEATEEDVVEGESCSAEESVGMMQRMARPATLDQFIDKWILTHSRQVNRMLPGGLSLIGIFAVAPTSQLQASQIKLKQMLYAVHKQLSKTHIPVSPDPITDRILLQIDTNTRKLSCSTIDVSDGKSSPRPAEWKYQSSPSRWATLNSSLSIDLSLSLPRTERNPNLFKQMQGGLSSFCDSVKDAVCSIDGVIRDVKEPLIASASEPQATGHQRRSGGGGRGGGRDRGHGDGVDSSFPASNVKLFLPMTNTSKSDNGDPPPTKPVPSSANLRVCGKLCIRAFVPAKSTVDDAIQAVKTDILRSLHARCELLCEEDEITEDHDTESVYNPPIRYFFQSHNDGIQLCDYSFEDEKETEIKHRINELINMTVEELDYVEERATEEDTAQYIQEETPEETASGPLQTKRKSNKSTNYAMFICGTLIAVSAFLVYLMVSWVNQQDEDQEKGQHSTA